VAGRSLLGLPDVDELFELALLIAAVDVLDEAHDAVQGGMGEHHCILRGQEGLKTLYTDKKENKIFHIYKKIQMGSGAKSYRKGFLIYEEMRKLFPIYEEAFNHI
jgi:hypothetical protein